jgi:magnesium-transporting ATPase (P-type)
VLCVYATQTIYDEWLMAFFNILITSLPPLAIATFEQDIPEKAIKDVRLLTHARTHARTHATHSI